MSKWRKKPVVVEAELYDGSKESIAKVLRLSNGIMLYSGDLLIKTLEGPLRAKIGDWIIKEIKGEVYPCKPDIFEATYEPVTEADHQEPTHHSGGSGSLRISRHYGPGRGR